MTATARSQYARLPGRKSGLLRRDTLWLGMDHVLFVRSSRFTEDYRRFYLADIQALVLQERPSGNRKIVDWVAIGVSALAVASLFVTHHQVWGVLLAIVAGLYAWLALRREDCKAWVQTAVGTAELPSLCRVKSARKALAIIGEKIRAAQPPMPAEELSRVLETPPPLPFTPAPRPPPLPVSPDAARPPSPLYNAAFVLLLGLGIVKLSTAFSSSTGFMWAMPLGYFCFLAMLIVPLVRHGARNIRGGRSAAVFTSLIVAGSIATYSLSWTTSRWQRKLQDANTQKMYDMMERAAPLQIGLGVVLLVLAIWGLLAFLTTSASTERRAGGPQTLFGPEGS
jgi:hypothetical protein